MKVFWSRFSSSLLYNLSRWSFCATGLEILDPEEVEYIRSNATVTVGSSVTMECGSVVPAIYIWGFTKPGTDNNIAVAHNYGQGPKVQAQSGSLGRVQLNANSSALLIEEVQKDAAGMYTCQALYDTEEGARVTFYFTRLAVDDNWSAWCRFLNKNCCKFSTEGNTNRRILICDDSSGSGFHFKDFSCPVLFYFSY